MKHLRLSPSFVLFICLNLVMSFTLAQYGRRVGKGGLGQMELGASFLNISDFNDALEAQDYLGVNQNFFALGIGLERFKGRMIYGGSLYNYMINQSLTNNQLAILSYHYGSLRIGGILAQEYEQYMVYPSIGLGYGLANFRERPSDEPLPFAHWSRGAMVDARISAQLFALMGAEHLVSLGIHAGYVYTLDNTWLLTDFDPDTSGISLSPKGLYIRVSLGMARWKR
ncbi:MAG: hypothetical protein AAF587_18455 [Bacteroidota bacterium]